MRLQAVHLGESFRLGAEVGLVGVGQRVLRLGDLVFLLGDRLFLGEQVIGQADRLLQRLGAFRLREAHVVGLISKLTDTGLHAAAFHQEVPFGHVEGVPAFLQLDRLLDLLIGIGHPRGGLPSGILDTGQALRPGVGKVGDPSLEIARQYLPDRLARLADGTEAVHQLPGEEIGQIR